MVYKTELPSISSSIPLSDCSITEHMKGWSMHCPQQQPAQTVADPDAGPSQDKKRGAPTPLSAPFPLRCSTTPPKHTAFWSRTRASADRAQLSHLFKRQTTPLPPSTPPGQCLGHPPFIMAGPATGTEVLAAAVGRPL